MSDVVAARDDASRLEKMKPVLDRIPDHWGKYLPEIGWDDLLLDLDRKLAEIDPGYVIYQAKQKFGELRYYTAHSEEFIESQPSKETRSLFDNMVTWTETASTQTCEFCGESGESRGGGWIMVLCDEHAG